MASGSTAICAIIEDDFFHIAWLGDSQAVLVRNRKPVVIMDPHKPEREVSQKKFNRAYYIHTRNIVTLCARLFLR